MECSYPSSCLPMSGLAGCRVVVERKLQEGAQPSRWLKSASDSLMRRQRVDGGAHSLLLLLACRRYARLTAMVCVGGRDASSRSTSRTQASIPSITANPNLFPSQSSQSSSHPTNAQKHLPNPGSHSLSTRSRPKTPQKHPHPSPATQGNKGGERNQGNQPVRSVHRE